MLLCLVSSFSVAQCTYTISSENRLTTEATTTKSFTWFATEKLDSGESKYDYVVVANKGGKIVCNTVEKVVSNCDILVRGNDNWRFVSGRIGRLSLHLTSVEECVLEVLGHLQEVRGTLHSRPERSAGAGAEAAAILVCEAVHKATRAISAELDTVKNRQAAAALVPRILGGEDSFLHDRKV